MCEHQQQLALSFDREEPMKKMERTKTHSWKFKQTVPQIIVTLLEGPDHKKYRVLLEVLVNDTKMTTLWQ